MTRPVVDLSPEAVDAVAERMIELMHENGSPPSRKLVTAATLARELGVNVVFVYRHKVRLGGKPLGPTGKSPTGKDRKPRWRFDLAVARAAFDAETASVSPVGDKPAPTRRRRRTGTTVPLLEVKG